MSLISPKNFIAPLTNAVNLATIIVVAILFGIYRLSGGGVSISTRKPPSAITKEEISSRSAEKRLAETSKAPEIKTNPKNQRDLREDTPLRDLLEEDQESIGSLRDPAKKTPQKTGGSSLDDIAKQLGVE